MSKIKMTQSIINFFIKKRVEFKLETNIEDEGTNIQFNFLVDGIPDFAIFYNTMDDGWCIASIYEFRNAVTFDDYKHLKSEFESDRGIFQSFIACDEDLETGTFFEFHLYSKFDDEEFNEDKLDEIFTYMLNKTKFSKKLNLLVSEEA
ncbi:unknown [Firmicutes bacterium CAG:449]|nr:unknown [Firmicutes bacterium CAG:449]